MHQPVPHPHASKQTQQQIQHQNQQHHQQQDIQPKQQKPFSKVENQERNYYPMPEPKTSHDNLPQCQSPPQQQQSTPSPRSYDQMQKQSQQKDGPTTPKFFRLLQTITDTLPEGAGMRLGMACWILFGFLHAHHGALPTATLMCIYFRIP